VHTAENGESQAGRQGGRMKSGREAGKWETQLAESRECRPREESRTGCSVTGVAGARSRYKSLFLGREIYCTAMGQLTVKQRH
jgi:hypothetical protein